MLSFLSAAPARMRQKEVDALWWLYEHTAGKNWKDNSGWAGPSTDPCRRFSTERRWALSNDEGLDPADGVVTTWVPGAHIEASPWFGVGCHDPCDDYLDGYECAAGRAASLVLHDNNLRNAPGWGSFHEWTGLGQLRNLTWLDLSHNEIGGSLPTQIGRLKNVDILRLEYNSLEGTLPTELGKINNGGVLHYVELANPQTPVDLLHFMYRFTIDHNSISGTVPTELGVKGELEHLDVAHNSLTGTLPTELARLHRVQSLHMNDNLISGTLSSTYFDAWATRLSYLKLERNAISGSLPTTLGKLRHLVDFDLFDNQLAGTLPTQISGLRAVREFRLSDNKISGALPTEVGELRHPLEYLDVYNNPLSGTMPPTIFELINLKYLYVPNAILDPILNYKCQERIPRNGKYNWRIVRDEYPVMMAKYCPEPYDVQFAFEPLQGDV